MNYLTFLLSFFSAFFSGVIWSDSTHFKKIFYRIKTRKITKDCRIVLLADLHEKTYGKGNVELIRAIDHEHPDCIIMAGDMITAGREPELNPVAQLVIALSEKYPVYYVMGNHELKLKEMPWRYKTKYAAFRHALESCGAKVLDDAGKYLPGTNIRILGLTADLTYYRKHGKKQMDAFYVKRHLGARDKYSYQILVGHNPEYGKVYADWGADLSLAGHYHGGFMRIPFSRSGGLISPKYELFPRCAGGMVRYQKSCMIVSRGLGMHTLPLRIFNPGELVVIDLMRMPRSRNKSEKTWN